MKTIMASTPHDSFSFSRRYFNFPKKNQDNTINDDEEILTFESSSHSFAALNLDTPQKKKKHLPSLRSLFTNHRRSPLGGKVIGTLFGHRRGHVHIAFQDSPHTPPAFLVQLSTPTGALVREMASGLVRVALECDRKTTDRRPVKPVKLLHEPLWRAYCNGKKCGYAARRECGEEEVKVLAAVGPVTMGAGVLPGKDEDGVGADGELMYMRARFERVVGSRDSESFYMINPDGGGGPELSVYLLRV